MKLYERPAPPNWQVVITLASVVAIFVGLGMTAYYTYRSIAERGRDKVVTTRNCSCECRVPR